MLHGFALTVCLFASLLQSKGGRPDYSQEMFTDVKEGHWLYAETEKLAQARIGAWPWPSHSRPGSHHLLTRYEFAVGLLRTLQTLAYLQPGRDRPTKSATVAGPEEKTLEDITVEELKTLIRIRKELNREIASMEPTKELRVQDRMVASALKAARAREERLKPGAPAQVPFQDVDEDHWAAATLRRLKQLGLIVGFPDGSFRGNRAMTRDELASSLNRLLQPHGDPPGPPRRN